MWIRLRIRIQHFKWIRIQGFKKKIQLTKIAIYLFLSLHKGRPSYRRSLQPSKENIQHFKKWNLLTFILFLWVIYVFLDPDLDPQHWFEVIFLVRPDLVGRSNGPEAENILWTFFNANLGILFHRAQTDLHAQCGIQFIQQYERFISGYCLNPFIQRGIL